MIALLNLVAAVKIIQARRVKSIRRATSCLYLLHEYIHAKIQMCLRYFCI